MNLDLRLLAAAPLTIGSIVLAVLIIQVLVMWAIGRYFHYTHRAALLLAALLASGSEFAFVVYATAERAGLLTGDIAAKLNLVVALAMSATPLLVGLVGRIGERLGTRGLTARAFDEMPGEKVDVVIAGFGRVGQIPGRLLAANRVRYTVIEPSADQVDFSRRFGSVVHYGDPARPEILRAARVGEARVFVLAIDDPEHSVRVARTLRRLYPELPVIARARNRQHAFALMDLGIGCIVRETLLSSLEMSRKMLDALGDPDGAAKIERFRAFDERLLVEQHLLHKDEAALIQSAQQARVELESLFEAATADGTRRAGD